jgi:hypothetical protein
MSARLAAWIAATAAAATGVLFFVRRSRPRPERVTRQTEEDREAEIIKLYAPALDAVAREQESY